MRFFSSPEMEIVVRKIGSFFAIQKSPASTWPGCCINFMHQPERSQGVGKELRRSRRQRCSTGLDDLCRPAARVRDFLRPGPHGGQEVFQHPAVECGALELQRALDGGKKVGGGHGAFPSRSNGCRLTGSTAVWPPSTRAFSRSAHSALLPASTSLCQGL